MSKVERYRNYKSKTIELKCETCMYYEICNQKREIDCDHYLSAYEEYSWYEDDINKDREIHYEQWFEYVREDFE